MPKDVLALPLDVAATRPILETIANKWTVLILSVLCTQPARFNDLKRRLDGITHKALSEALKRLERNGLITGDLGEVVLLPGKPRLTFDDGLDVVRMLMTAYQSAEQGKTLAFPPKGLDKFVPAVARGDWKP